MKRQIKCFRFMCELIPYTNTHTHRHMVKNTRSQITWPILIAKMLNLSLSVSLSLSPFFLCVYQSQSVCSFLSSAILSPLLPSVSFDFSVFSSSCISCYLPLSSRCPLSPILLYFFLLAFLLLPPVPLCHILACMFSFFLRSLHHVYLSFSLLSLPLSRCASAVRSVGLSVCLCLHW